MIERSDSDTAQHILRHTFKPSVPLASKLSEVFAEPCHPNDLQLESPRRLAVDLEEYSRSRYDMQLAQARKAFIDKPKLAGSEALGVQAIGASWLKPALLGIYFEVDTKAFQEYTQDLFRMRSTAYKNDEYLESRLKSVQEELRIRPSLKRLREERQSIIDVLGSIPHQEAVGHEISPAAEQQITLLRLVVPARKLLATQAVKQTLQTIAQDLESPKKDMYSVLPYSITGVDRSR